MYAQLDDIDPVYDPPLRASRRLDRSLTAMLRMVLMACILFVLAACAASNGTATSLPATESTAYQLGTGDEVKISIYGFDALSGTFAVNDQGAISLPLAGAVPLTKKTLPEAEAAVAGALIERQVAVNPSVSIQVVKYRPFFVLGEVQKPGSYTFLPGMSVLQAISVAGGHTFRADRKSYGISRNVDGRAIKGKVDETALVQPGDTVIVYESWF